MPQIDQSDIQAEVEVRSRSGAYDLVTIPDGKKNVRLYGVITDVAHGWFEAGDKALYYVTPHVKLLNEAGTLLNLDRVIIGNYDPVQDKLYALPGKEAIWTTAYYLFGALGYRNEENKILPEHVNAFMGALLNSRPTDNLEIEDALPSAGAGLLVYVSIVHVPYTNNAGETGIRNGIGQSIKVGANGKAYPSGGWSAVDLERFAEERPELIDGTALGEYQQIFIDADSAARYFDILANPISYNTDPGPFAGTAFA